MNLGLFTRVCRPVVASNCRVAAWTSERREISGLCLRNIFLKLRKWKLKFRSSQQSSNFTNRNSLYLVIGTLAIVAVVFGYQLYQDRQKPTGIEINVGKTGISIEKN